MPYPAPTTRKRTFIPADFQIESWEGLKVHYDFLLAQSPETLEELEQFIEQISELEAMVSEEMAWRYIRMSCDNQNSEKVEAFQFFVREIRPHVSSLEDQLNRKLLENPFFEQLDAQRYATFTRALKREVELFRKENVALSSEQQSLARQYGSINGAVTIEHEGENLTLQQASALLENQDRELREKIWRKVSARRKEDHEQLEGLFEQLLELRVKEAQNAGFESYTDYKFAAMKRFDYTPADCKVFHETVAKTITPMFVELQKERKNRLGLDNVRPWDMQVGIFGDKPLKPFETGQEMIEKAIEALGNLRPEIGEVLARMDRMDQLDVETRPGKSPGGFNYPLLETGVPFIFMNSAGTQKDLTTILHESGHALHAFLTREIPINAMKVTPSEVGELAAMSMELLAMDQYPVFYQNEDDIVRARKEQLFRCIMVLPWIATVDAFQQWAYDHPDHSREERAAQWKHLYYRFHGEEVDWSGFEEDLAHTWMRVGHIFEVPFYFVEYAMAQLGALAIWRNYRLDPASGLEAYLNALKLGYTKSIPELYEAAGIRFDFSEDYTREIAEFCMTEYKVLGMELSAG